MKIYLSILACLLCACYNTEEKIPENILSETVFEDILKQIHLSEGAFELHKTNGMKNAKNELAHNYSTIYETHEITADDFNKTLDYYAQHPEQLEKIYTRILEQLIKDKTILDQQ